MLSQLHWYSILESEVQALVAILLSLDLIRLVRNALSAGHGIPSLRLLPVEPTEVLSLGDEDHERQSANGDEDLVAAVVVGDIVLAVEFCKRCQLG
jgi:hypothetical protein